MENNYEIIIVVIAPSKDLLGTANSQENCDCDIVTVAARKYRCTQT